MELSGMEIDKDDDYDCDQYDSYDPMNDLLATGLHEALYNKDYKDPTYERRDPRPQPRSSQISHR
jgi:hypothetical protein